MRDSFGRVTDYLRISLTDRCNLRCRYCMPTCGVKDIPHREILSFEEILRILRIMAGQGLKKVRLTGGEPLLRKGVDRLIADISRIPGIEETLITTNGILLSRMCGDIKNAGVKRVNISLDTLDKEVFAGLTGTDRLDEVLKGIDTAYDSGIGIRINCVPIRGINDRELESIALIARDREIDVRFIELMPIGLGAGFEGISSGEILERLKTAFGGYKEERKESRSPAFYCSFQGFKGRIGTISPMSHKFCESCDRLRLTSDGFLKLCLQYPAGADLKTPMREGISDEGLERLILETVKKKPLAHSFEKGELTDRRKMVQIGG